MKPEDHSRTGSATAPPSETATDSDGGESTVAHSSQTLPLKRTDERNRATLFLPHQLIAERYRIVRFVGRGGMGEVYEVEDLALREHVALKTIRPSLADRPETIERFRQEILLARKIAHSNVCRVFDVGFHRLDSSDRPITFFTMELLSGETLSSHLKKRGPLTTTEAFPIVEQMAAALAAAHRTGIIHRDFKSANVILVKSSEMECDVRAVVTDFGLACSMNVSEPHAESTADSGEIVGTPAYMAPEQVEGVEVTARADIYALGIVLYEMVTGQRPFSGPTPFAVATKRLHEDAPSPRRLVHDLDSRWVSAILRCLDRNPLNRFAVATEIASALVASQPRGGHWVRRRLLLVAAAVACATAAVAWTQGRRNAESALPAIASRPLAVAVKSAVENAVTDAGLARGPEARTHRSQPIKEMATPRRMKKRIPAKPTAAEPTISSSASAISPLESTISPLDPIDP